MLANGVDRDKSASPPPVHSFDQHKDDFKHNEHLSPDMSSVTHAALEINCDAAAEVSGSTPGTDSFRQPWSNCQPSESQQIVNLSEQSSANKKYAQDDHDLAVAHREPAYGPVIIPCCIMTLDIQKLSVLAFDKSRTDEQMYTSRAEPIGKSTPDCKAQNVSVERLPIDDMLSLDPDDDLLTNYPLIEATQPLSTAETSLSVDWPGSIRECHARAAFPDHEEANLGVSISDELEWEIEAMKSVVAPVTKDNIKELELPAIQNTLSLRIDLCFDHDLYFQRISGIKGKEKQIKARVFYKCLSLELKAIMHSLQHSALKCKHKQHSKQVLLPSRLASFFSALRDLLELLVPDAEKDDVVQRVDADWLTTQVRVGKFEAVPFATWLCDLLMRHCAPMRDEMAKEMREKIVNGAENYDMDLLVEGLETLLNLLENMKIDVANHQVRSFKLLLIADTVPFLRDCFSKMVDNHQLSLSGSIRWFERAQKRYQEKSWLVFDRYIHGLVQLGCSTDEPLPTTFAYDKERLEVLRVDVLDIVQLEICKMTYRELVLEQTKQSPSHATQQRIVTRILQLLALEDGTCDRVEQHTDAIAVELAAATAAAAAGIDVEVYTSHASEWTSNMDFEYAHKTLSGNLAKYHKEVVGDITGQLIARTISHAEVFRQLDTLQISNMQRNWSTDRLAKGLPLAADLEDVSRRLAHIAVIHWQVWYGLVYPDGSRLRSQSGSNPDLEAVLPSEYISP